MRRFKKDTSGNFATLTALTFPVALLLVGLTLDFSGFYLQKRELQSLTDIAVLIAAARFERPAQAAQELFADNDVSGLRLTEAAIVAPDQRALKVELGHYAAQSGVAAALRFEEAGLPVNAVRVSVQVPGQRFFFTHANPPAIAASAVASLAPEVSFSVGSRLAGLNGGLANALLGSLLGSSVSLTAMDYQALLDTDIGLLEFSDALAGELHLTAATYRDVLASEVTIGQLLAAARRLPALTAVTRIALQHLSTSAQSDRRTLQANALMSLGSAEQRRVGATQPGFRPRVGLLELINAAAWIANGTRQVGVLVGAGLPGLASATLELAVGEPAQSTPRFVVGADGAVVRTAQTRFKLDARIGSLLGTTVRLPIYGEVASAEARLTSAACHLGNASTQVVAIDARPGLATLALADVAPGSLSRFGAPVAQTPAQILTTPLVSITASAYASSTNTAPQRLTFDAREIAARAVKLVRTRNATETLTTSLIRNLDLRITGAGLGLGVPSGLTGSIALLATAATPSIDLILDGALAMLGLRLGEADVWVGGVTCGKPVLVQ